jgi:dTDP-glucose pyrophosphorylase
MQVKKPLTVVIPMAGLGTRFTDYGFKANKYMLPITVNLETMIEKAIVSLCVDTNTYDATFVFVTRLITKEIEDVLTYICKKNEYKYIIFDLKNLTDGPATTVYNAREHIPKEHSLIISNSDQVLDWDFSCFMEKASKSNGCVLTYTPKYHIEIGQLDKHSFAKVNTQGHVTDVAEKIAISNVALVGVHYYEKASFFFDAYKVMIANNIRAPNNELYVSLTYKVMLQQNRSVAIYHIDQKKECFFPTGEPQDYFDYLYKCGGYKLAPQQVNNMQLLPNVMYKTFHRGEIYRHDRYCLCILTGELQGKIYCNKPSIVFTECTKAVIVEDIDTHEDDKSIYECNDFVRGWFMGDFTPSICKTKEFEIGYLHHKKNERWDYHYHKESTEYNILIKGEMLINNIIMKENDLFVIQKNQIACPQFLQDCRVLCIKIPHVKNDKYCI